MKLLPSILRSIMPLAAAASFGVSHGWAQTAHFGGVQTTTTITFSSYAGVAVDSAGDVFVADDTNDRIVEIKASGDTAIDIGGGTPQYLTLDSSNNLYVTTTSPAAVKKLTWTGSGYGAAVTLSNRFVSPWGIALDSLRDVFVVDHGGNALYKLAPNGSSYTFQLINDTSFNGPDELAIDANNLLYIADGGHNRVLEMNTSGTLEGQLDFSSSPTGVAVDSRGDLAITGANLGLFYENPNGNGVYTSTLLGTNFIAPYGVAFDAAGNMYVNDSGATDIVRQSPMTANFGEVNIGSTSSPLSLAFVFDVPSTLNSVQGLTQGAPKLDFKTMSGGSCVAGTGYSEGATCTVAATFVPMHAGARYGAVQLIGAGGMVLASAYVQGNGEGAQIAFAPAQRAISNSIYGMGVAIDGAGNLYEANTTAAGTVVKLGPAGGIPETIVSGLSYPAAVAVDGAGNVYIADSGRNQVMKETLSGGAYDLSFTFGNLSNPQDVAVDGSGNVYIADTGNNLVLKETFSGQGYTQSSIGSGLNSPFGVAVDGGGNVYIADTGNNVVWKETLSGGVYTQSQIGSSLYSPGDVAVDSIGNVYISDTGNYRVLKEIFSGGSYHQSSIGRFTFPTGLAVDGAGDVYIPDALNYRVVIETVNQPPAITFPSTAFGQTSSPVATTITNLGNQPLTFPPPSAGSNPSTAANFVLETNGDTTCPVTDPNSLAATLHANESCTLSYRFEPQEAGVVKGTSVLSDNNLGAAAATQSISLSGSAIQATPVISWATPSPITYGAKLSAAQLDATSSVAGTFAYNPMVGTTLTAGSHTLTATFTPTNTVDYQVSTKNVTLTVNQATPNITWATPAPINHGTALSSTQLDATANVPGTFVYNPKAGTVLAAGNQKLSTTFTPTDSVDYKTATATVVLKVN